MAMGQILKSEEIVTHSMGRYRKYVAQNANATWKYGENQYTITRPEGDRQFYVYVPKKYDGSASFPLLFAWHGLGDTAESFGNDVGFKNYSESVGFIYVYPQGYAGPLGNAHNAGTCCESTTDDITFTRLMLDFVHNSLALNINAQSVWTAGFSNGAMMSERLACEMPDVFSAAVSVSGVVAEEPGNAAGLASCDSLFVKAGKKLVNMLLVHGDNDWVVPWTGDALLGFPPIPDNYAAWIKRFACLGQPESTLNKGTFTNQVYPDCNGVRLEVVKNAGGGHQWPCTSDFCTTDYIMQFLLKQLK